MLSKSCAIKECRETVGSMKGVFVQKHISATLMIMGKIQREKNLIMQEIGAEVMLFSWAEECDPACNRKVGLTADKK